ncbi:hypothetical protein HMPREF7215_2246 [Pyramidobacter piscolens W5455]|uniref:Uncharacterized protein n=1 Tax=Pyramidobacter piscolens W5455 TaxID=352165 RepID=A0ABM9ZU44_9BACT|nr:hypothetical protein HMPREF7215_2246 [Pyramidobacter piscolens W5455]
MRRESFLRHRKNERQSKADENWIIGFQRLQLFHVEHRA